MSSDSRWSGGLMNRQWQRGTRVAAPVSPQYVLGQVREYLRDCRRFHLEPSEGTAVKVVFGPDVTVRAAYAELTGGAR